MDKKVLHLHKISIFTYILCVNEYLLFYYDWNSTFPRITNPCWKVITPGIQIRHILTGGCKSFGYGYTLKYNKIFNVKLLKVHYHKSMYANRSKKHFM